MVKKISAGHVIAVLFTLAVFSVGIMFSSEWWRLSSRCAKAKEAILATLPNPLGSVGTNEVAFCPTYNFTCHEMLVVEHSIPCRSAAEAKTLLKGLRAELAVVDKDGETWIRAINEETFFSYHKKAGADSTPLVYLFTPFPPGQYRLRLTVSEPAPGLANTPHRVEVRYQLCGLEYLNTNIVGAIAGFFLLAAGFLTRAIKRNLSRARGLIVGTPGQHVPRP